MLSPNDVVLRRGPKAKEVVAKLDKIKQCADHQTTASSLVVPKFPPDVAAFETNHIDLATNSVAPDGDADCSSSRPHHTQRLP